MTAFLDLRTEPMIQRLNDWFDQTMSWPKTRHDHHFIRVEESMTDDALQIRAELPGVDPDADIEINVAEGVLTIAAERREQRSADENGRHFSEFDYGSFRRSLRVPDNLDPEAITAEYSKGILTVSVPMPTPDQREVKRVPITTGD
jgi:HSP20 family protein